VQLGSLCKVEEDPALVTHIRHLFLALTDPLADHASNLMQCDINSPSDRVMIFLIQCSCKIGRDVISEYNHDSLYNFPAAKNTFQMLT
jgi:hypothetical protein